MYFYFHVLVLQFNGSALCIFLHHGEFLFFMLLWEKLSLVKF